MSTMTVAILSPGEMGAAVGGVLRQSGLEVVTCLADRSEVTRARASRAGLLDVPNLESLVQSADLVLSILVPAEAGAIAGQVASALAAAGSSTAYADCNAIAPQSVRTMASRIESAGGTFIDAGIIGGPPRPTQAPRFYASGPDVSALVELDGRGIEVVPVGTEIGRASAVKMCYAALTKGTTALQTALLTAAERLGVYSELQAELQRSQRSSYERAESATRRLPAVAHRWIGEMEEIAATFADVGVTPLFHRGAAEMFRMVAASALVEGGGDAQDLHEAIAVLAGAAEQARRLST